MVVKEGCFIQNKFTEKGRIRQSAEFESLKKVGVLAGLNETFKNSNLQA